MASILVCSLLARSKQSRISCRNDHHHTVSASLIPPPPLPPRSALPHRPTNHARRQSASALSLTHASKNRHSHKGFSQLPRPFLPFLLPTTTAYPAPPSTSTTEMSLKRSRGALIAFEGLDRAGKSSQCAAAAAALLHVRQSDDGGGGGDGDGGSSGGEGGARGGDDVRVLRFPGTWDFLCCASVLRGRGEGAVIGRLRLRERVRSRSATRCGGKHVGEREMVDERAQCGCSAASAAAFRETDASGTRIGSDMDMAWRTRAEKSRWELWPTDRTESERDTHTSLRYKRA